jgi:hypothetical protein
VLVVSGNDEEALRAHYAALKEPFMDSRVCVHMCDLALTRLKKRSLLIQRASPAARRLASAISSPVRASGGRAWGNTLLASFPMARAMLRRRVAVVHTLLEAPQWSC